MWASWRFEVVDMDGRRIDAILARASPDQAASAAIESWAYNGGQSGLGNRFCPPAAFISHL